MQCGLRETLFLHGNNVILTLADSALSVNDRVSHLPDDFIALTATRLELVDVPALRSLDHRSDYRSRIELQDVLLGSEPSQNQTVTPPSEGEFPFWEPLISYHSGVENAA
jgi:hypothetical protein